MKTTATVLVLFFSCVLQSVAADDGFVPLFDGKTLDGWQAARSTGAGDTGAFSVNVQEQAIATYGGQDAGSKQQNDCLVSEEQFSHFILKLEYKWLDKRFAPRGDWDRDAGLLFHVHDDLTKVWPHSFEMQIGESSVDKKGSRRFHTGDLFVLGGHLRATTPRNGKSFAANGKLVSGRSLPTDLGVERPKGQWNEMEIRVQGGNEATFILNGEVVLELFDLEQKTKDGNYLPLDKGHIGLQAEWAEILYRNIRIKELPPVPSTSRTASRTTSRTTSRTANTTASNSTNKMSLTVQAGMDAFALDSGKAWLEGSVSGATTTAWEKVSGPGSVTFANASQAATTASFESPGVYELSLTAKAGDEQVTDTMRVQVHAAGDIVHAINCGQTKESYQSTNGIEYAKDEFFVGGGVDKLPGNAVARTGDDGLYNYARAKNDSFKGYALPVDNGVYTVHLQFAETFWDGDERMFDTFIESRLVMDDVNLVARAGKWVAYDRTFLVDVTDGTLNIEFNASANNPVLNGLVVVKHSTKAN